MVIVSHQLFCKMQSGEFEMPIRIHRPIADGSAWSCTYEIKWPEGLVQRRAHGGDELQALIMALKMIGADIYTSEYHKEGRLRAYEKEKGYGFPVPTSLRDMLVGADAI